MNARDAQTKRLLDKIWRLRAENDRLRYYLEQVLDYHEHEECGPLGSELHRDAREVISKIDLP